MPIKRVHRPRPNHSAVEDVYRTIGARIRARREFLKMTRTELCRRLKMSRRNLQNIEESRQRVMLHHIQDIATALETKPAELIKGLL